MFLFLLACGGAKPAGAPTWSADVAPVGERNCVGCHHDGGVGGADFTTYAGAAERAPLMAAYVAGGLMPPPAMDPDCQSYVGHERMVLSDGDAELLSAWAEADAPEGEAIGALSWSDLALSRVDAEVVLPVAHEVSPAADGNEYHCQILPNPATSTVFVTGFDVLVDQPSVVHHTVLAIDRGGDAGEASGDADLSDGWDCGGRITEPDWDILHAWAPGTEPTIFGEGMGLRVEPGDQVVMQMHYFGGAGTVDQSGYAFSVASSVTTEIYMNPVGPTDFVLPADEVTTVEEAQTNDYGVSVTVHGVFPHMHQLAVGYESTLDDTCLARADAWDFGHQTVYLYETPQVWAPGETLTSRCTYDNTADNPQQPNDPPQDVDYGEGTNQEMCFFLYYYSI